MAQVATWFSKHIDRHFCEIVQEAGYVAGMENFIIPAA